MRFEGFSFGSIRIDGTTHEHDVVIDAGQIRKRKKKPSRKFRDGFGHTPLSIEEDIPWKCRRLVIGSGAYGRLPVMSEVKREAERRRVELLIVPTTEAARHRRQQRNLTRDLLITARKPFDDQYENLSCSVRQKKFAYCSLQFFPGLGVLNIRQSSDRRI